MIYYLLDNQKLFLRSPDPRDLVLTINCVATTEAFVPSGTEFIYYQALGPGIYTYEILDGVTVEDSGTIYVFANSCCDQNIDDIRQRTTRIYPGFPDTVLRVYFENSCVPYNPYSVTSVEIRLPDTTLIETITNIQNHGVGVYQVTVALEPGEYTETWFYRETLISVPTSVMYPFTILDRDTTFACKYISPYSGQVYKTDGLWGGASSELDLRQEIAEILYGTMTGPPHGRKLLLRRMERDTNGDRIHCICYDSVTGGGDKNCKYCKGDMFKFNEEFITGYIAWPVNAIAGTSMLTENNIFKPGVFIYTKPVLYTEHFVKPLEGDKIYQVAIDERNGSIQVPLVRQRKFAIARSSSHMADFGRIEFWASAMELEDK